MMAEDDEFLRPIVRTVIKEFLEAGDGFFAVTLGLCAVEEVGEITFAQDQSADFDSMPRNAIAAGCVDFVLPPSGIAQELAHCRCIFPGASCPRTRKVQSGCEGRHGIS